MSLVICISPASKVKLTPYQAPAGTLVYQTTFQAPHEHCRQHLEPPLTLELAPSRSPLRVQVLAELHLQLGLAVTMVLVSLAAMTQVRWTDKTPKVVDALTLAVKVNHAALDTMSTTTDWVQVDGLLLKTTMKSKMTGN